jgi:hypothetical protein
LYAFLVVKFLTNVDINIIRYEKSKKNPYQWEAKMLGSEVGKSGKQKKCKEGKRDKLAKKRLIQEGHQPAGVLSFPGSDLLFVRFFRVSFFPFSELMSSSMPFKPSLNPLTPLPIAFHEFWNF